jgi:SAM-dependent methyltransferase
MVAGEIPLQPTACAICGCFGNAREIYGPTFLVSDLNPVVFSARRNPDRIHYRIVQCQDCGLLRSDPVADEVALESLYRRSQFDYGEEVDNLRRTYRRYLKKIPERSGAFLEIGCGNGFVLQEALSLGYSDVAGVEPGAEAVSLAPLAIRSRIRCSMMRRGLFDPGTFGTIAMFQVLDHLPDPRAILEECFRLLRPGGYLFCLQHNARAWTARLLGEGSPIFDIEHTYLYSAATLRRLVAGVGFRPLVCKAVWNRYSLRYLARLAGSSTTSRFPIWAPLGNQYLIAQKPL